MWIWHKARFSSSAENGKYCSEFVTATDLMIRSRERWLQLNKYQLSWLSYGPLLLRLIMLSLQQFSHITENPTIHFWHKLAWSLCRSHRLVTQSQETAPLQVPATSIRLSQIPPCTFAWQTSNLGVPMTTSPTMDDLLEHMTHLAGKTWYLWIQFHYKGYNSRNSQVEDLNRARFELGA